jgi:hypothetical protein
VLAKVYGSFALTGNIGPAAPAGTPGDVQGIDEGFSDFYRLFWKAQELSTDEAVISWGDVGIQDFHNMNWTSNNSFLTVFIIGAYTRLLYAMTSFVKHQMKNWGPEISQERMRITSGNTPGKQDFFVLFNIGC